MIIFPNAKINLGLYITNRRSDNYHDLETVFYPVGIKDALEIIESEELQFTSSGIPIPGNSQDNLCLKAYQLLARDFSLPPVHIHLHKQIPIGAGLGGGSADAAFCLRLINDKFSLRLGAEQMEHYARQLGADCAFFIRNTPVLAFEKGDRFQEIELDLSNYYMVLVMPPVHVSTAEAYSKVRPQKPEIPLTEIIRKPVNLWKEMLVNDFERSVFDIYPQIAEVKDQLYKAGALYASMSGSGASVYGIFEEDVKLPLLEQANTVYYGI